MTGARPLRIGFAGLTHLAICSAVAAAERGFEVLCFDANPSTVDAFRSRRFPIYEPQLDELASNNAARLTATTQAGDLRKVDLCFVAPDIPTGPDGQSDLREIKQLIETVDGSLAVQAPMVVLSQVPPGFVRALARPASSRFCQVETLVFGQAMTRALKPERFIVGCADPSVPLPPSYQAFLDAFRCPILQMGYESAELAKISINMFLVSSVTTTNTIAELCEKIGADWQEIVPALRLDRRIGEYAYLSPGLGIAGGNLERDLATFIELGATHSTDIESVRAWLHNSERRREWVFDILNQFLLVGGTSSVIGMLGLAYKQDTASTRNSAALALLSALPLDCAVRAFDPVVKVDFAWRASGLIQASSELDACCGANAVVVMTPWPAFKRIDVEAMAEAMSGRIVVDPYGVLDAAACQRAGLSQHRLGKGVP